jgi:hypothetical protein
MNEEWRDVPGFEGYYQISSLKRVKSLKRTIERCDGKQMRIKEKILTQTKCAKTDDNIVSLSLNSQCTSMCVEIMHSKLFKAKRKPRKLFKGINKNAKATPDQVKEIRHTAANTGCYERHGLIERLCKKYYFNRGVVASILSKRTWNNLE